MYVVVTGAPASGKSTLARALADELGLPLLAKDTIKQALLDELGAVDVAESRRLGNAAVSPTASSDECTVSVIHAAT